MRKFLLVFATCLALTNGTSTLAKVSEPLYVAQASISGPDGRWDLVTVDTQTNRLFVARADSVNVIDIGAPDSVQSWGSISHGHAAIPLSDLGLLLVTSGADASARILSLKDGSQKASIGVDEDPDDALYDPESKYAYVMNAKAGTVSIIDPATATLLASIALKPGLEGPVMVSNSLLAVNNEDESEIEFADLKTHSADGAIRLTGCEGPTGLAYDPVAGLAVSACGNGKAAVVDLHARKLLKLLSIGLGPDGAMFDSKRHRILIPCGRSGTLSVIAFGGGEKTRVIGTITTEIGARTGALDPRTGFIYLPTAHFAPPEKPGDRPLPIAGSFHILVLKPSGS